MHFAALLLSFTPLVSSPQDTIDLSKFTLVDRVEVIVNDEILTYRQVMATAARSIPAGATPTPRQLADLRTQVGHDLIDERLAVQGGIDMGFEEEAVNRVVAGTTDRLVGSAGGVVQMADNLDGEGVSLSDQENELRRNLYRFSWERAITGANVGVAGRPFRDRYVRPGRLKLRYELLGAGQLGAEQISGTSGRYHLQEISFPIHGEEGGEPARLRAEIVHRNLEGGLEFAAAVQSSDQPGPNDGLLPPMTGAELARSGGPDVLGFALSAAKGEVSQPMPILRGGRLAGWRLMKLVDTEAPLLPIFELARTQNLLRRMMQTEADDYRREAGLKALNSGAYIWITGMPKS